MYYTDDHITIRRMIESDARKIYDTYLSYGWHPSLETYERYFAEQGTSRTTFVAEYDGEVAGHVSLIYTANEGPFPGLPLISDLCVFFHLHNRGIASRLLDVLETEAAKMSDTVCLAVGCHSGYGAAQRMYVKRGYSFDGSGVWWNGRQLEQYAPCENDDDLLLWMSKTLR
ncbi:MAG: GNAT family N-acetyltransferase [Clostridia bacterium]|nr:GNAT family N-acetyltransferase [Clostridia bacterium]